MGYACESNPFSGRCIRNNTKEIIAAIIEIEARIVELQKTIILYSARILRNVFEVWGVLLTQNLNKFDHWSKT